CLNLSRFETPCSLATPDCPADNQARQHCFYTGRCSALKKIEIMGKLIIERSSEWTNKMLEMGLYLNDSKIGNITDGEIKEIDLEPGEYYLAAKLGIWKSKPFFIEMTSKTVKKVELSGLYYGEGFL